MKVIDLLENNLELCFCGFLWQRQKFELAVVIADDKADQKSDVVMVNWSLVLNFGVVEEEDRVKVFVCSHSLDHVLWEWERAV